MEAKTRCGIEYTVGTKYPVTAKYALWYQGYVQFYRVRNAAERAQKRLPWVFLQYSEITKIG